MIKKIIASIVCIAILAGGLFVPQTTNAQWAVFDTIMETLTGMNTATGAANWVTTVAKWAKDELAKTLRDAVVKAIVNEINKQTVSWIQGGGSPRFVTDWQGFLKDAAMEGVNQTISQSQLADLCTPFAFQLRIALIPETQTISKRAKCSISDIVANVDDFYKNFQNGGWLAYGESIKPENNLYMQLVMFDDDMKIRSSFSEEKKKQEAGAGSGFLSVTKCLETDIDAIYDECIANASSGGPPSQSDISYCQDYALQTSSCTKEQVQTPGDAVAGTVRNLIGSDNIYVSGVQSIISAAINAGINRMMTEGLSLMTGNENPQRGFNPATQYSNELNALNNDTKQDLTRSIKPIIERWRALLDIKTASLSYIQQTQTNLQSIKTIQDSGVQCPPPVTQQEITAAGVALPQLTQDVNILQTKMNDGQKVTDQIAAADMNNIRQSTLATNAAKSFMEKYGSEDVNNPINNSFPSIRQAAWDEQAPLKTHFDDVVSRLQTCKSAQAAVAPAP